MRSLSQGYHTLRDDNGGRLCLRFERQDNVPAIELYAAAARRGGQKIGVARKPRRADGGRMAEQRVHVRDLTGNAVFHDADRLTVAAALAEIVADPQNGAGEIREQVRKFQFQIPLQKSVQRRERLVEQYGPRLRGENARERRALLLSAGELSRVLFLQPFQLEAAQLLLRAAALFGAAAGADAAPDVLQHRHVRKEGVLLEEIPYPPFLRREIDVLFAVEERFAVEDDVSPVRRHDPGDAFERYALAAAGSAEQRHRAAAGFKL